MKKILIVILILILLISGCSQDSVETHSIVEEPAVTENEENTATQGEIPASIFHSEYELVEGVKLAKNDKEKFKETLIGGKKNNNDKLENRDYYYMPVNIPNGFEFSLIAVTPNLFYSRYVEIGKEFVADEAIYFAYYSIDPNITIEEVIKVNDMVQSPYSKKLFFDYNTVQKRYDCACFEMDNHVFYMQFPYEISLDNKDEVKMIEELCKMKKIKID